MIGSLRPLLDVEPIFAVERQVNTARFDTLQQMGQQPAIAPGREEAIVISMTHLKIPYHHPLTKEIRT